MKFVIALLLALLTGAAHAQITNAPPLLNNRGTAPNNAQCTAATIGLLFFDTNATAGSNLYGCTSAATWTLMSGSGSGTITAGTVGQCAVYTAATTVGGVDCPTMTARAQGGILYWDATAAPGNLNNAVITGPACGNGTSAPAVCGSWFMRRTCSVVIGDSSSASVVTNTQLGPQKRLCMVPATATVLEINVTSDSATTQPSVIVGRSRCTTFTTGVCTAETRVNLVSGALSAAAGGFEACTNTGGTTGLDGGTTCTNTLQNTGLTQGDFIELVSGTAGGVAKLVVVTTVFTLNAQ